MTFPDQNYTSWHCGMNVVCVKRDPWVSDIGNCADRGRKPEYGEICQIGAIVADWEGVFVRLDGFHARTLFLAKWFKPLAKRDADISCFTAMLSPKPAKAKKVRA